MFYWILTRSLHYNKHSNQYWHFGYSVQTNWFHYFFFYEHHIWWRKVVSICSTMNFTQIKVQLILYFICFLKLCLKEHVYCNSVKWSVIVGYIVKKSQPHVDLPLLQICERQIPQDLDQKVIKNKLPSYNSKYLYWILFVFKNYAYKTMLLVIR